jgi:hypothetical protein
MMGLQCKQYSSVHTIYRIQNNHVRDFALVPPNGALPVPGCISVPHSMHARRSQELEGQGQENIQEHQPQAAPENTPADRREYHIFFVLNC